MVSSKDQSKKVSKGLRQLSKRFFEDFYAKAKEAGRFPSPHEAAVALGRILKRATGEEWPPELRDSPGVSTEVSDLVASEFFQQGYHEAVEAWYRHTPGLEIKKGKPGRPLDTKAQEYFEQHSGDSSYADIAKQELHEEPEGESKKLQIKKERERIRASVRRSRRR